MTVKILHSGWCFSLLGQIWKWLSPEYAVFLWGFALWWKNMHRCLENLLTHSILQHSFGCLCVAHSIWEPKSNLNAQEEFDSNRFLCWLWLHPVMCVISAWQWSDLKPSWWELICYLSSSFTQMIWVNVITEFRSQMRRDVRKESEFSFFPVLMQNILLLCPSLLFGLLIILCLKDVFIFPLIVMAWEMSFLAFLVPWEKVQIWHNAVLSSWSCSWPENW